MYGTGIFTKVLTVVGVVFAWFPLAATVLTSRGGMIGRGEFHVDWLMPAEIFPAAAIGGVLLLWAALRAHARVKPIAWCLGLAVVSLVASLGLAQVTGLASGEAEPGGWRMVLVVRLLAGYTLALVVAAHKAKDLQARQLYISATPSENTINFYLRLGCVVTPEPNVDLLELEPDDIHLEYTIP